jgi:hypothetical protein
VHASIDDVTREFDSSHFKQITPVRQGQQLFFVVRATPTLRVFFERTDEGVRVLDLVDAEQLAYFRDEATPAAH